MNQESLVKEQKDYRTVSEEISLELAAKMVKDYHDKYSLEESNSFIVGKNLMEQTLAQPGCVGIRFFEALNEQGNKTLVYVGIDEKGNSILEYPIVNEHGKIVVLPGMLVDKAEGPKPNSWFSA